MKKIVRCFRCLALIAFLSSQVLAAADLQDTPRPSLELTPADVVKIQVKALGNNDDPTPDAGIAIAYRFAAPANKAATGPLPRFAMMLKGPAYGPMLNHTGARFGKMEVNGDRATQLVILETQDAGLVSYRFTLGKVDLGPLAGCWMTYGVVRLQPDSA